MGDEAEQETGSKALVEMLFGVKLGRLMAEAEGSYRKILEPTPAVTQCKRAKGRDFQPGEICYMCGVAIPDKTNRQVSDWLYVECEHILPIGQARAFLDIYTHIDVKSFMDESGVEWYEKAIKLEYAQAHRICNQIKKDTSFIGNPSLKATEVRFDEGKTVSILKQIKVKASELSKNPNPDQSLYTDIAQMNIEDRKLTIKSIIDQIAAHIGVRNPGESDLLMLARASALVQPERLPEKARAVYYAYIGTIVRDPRQEFVGIISDLFPDLAPNRFSDYFYTKYLIPEGLRIDLAPYIQSILVGLYDHFKNQIDREKFSLPRSVEHNALKLILQKFIENGGSYNDDTKEWINFMINTIENIEMYKKHPIKVLNYGIRETTNSAIKKFKQSISRDKRERLREFSDYQLEPVPEEEWKEHVLDEKIETVYRDAVNRFIDYIIANKWLEENDEGIPQTKQSIIKDGVDAFNEYYKDLKEAGIEPDVKSVKEHSINEVKKRIYDMMVKITPNEDQARIATNKFSDLVRETHSSKVGDMVETEGGLRKRFRFKLNARSTSSRVSRTSKHSRLRKRAGKGGTYRVRQSAGKSRTWRQRLSLGSLRPSIPSYYGGNSNVQSDVEWGSFYANN